MGIVDKISYDKCLYFISSYSNRYSVYNSKQFKKAVKMFRTVWQDILKETWVFLLWLVLSSRQFVDNDKSNESNDCPGMADITYYRKFLCPGYSYSGSRLDRYSREFVFGEKGGESNNCLRVDDKIFCQ